MSSPDSNPTTAGSGNAVMDWIKANPENAKTAAGIVQGIQQWIAPGPMDKAKMNYYNAQANQLAYTQAQRAALNKSIMSMGSYTQAAPQPGQGGMPNAPYTAPTATPMAAAAPPPVNPLGPVATQPINAYSMNNNPYANAQQPVQVAAPGVGLVAGARS
jgi:hypothetical protein